MLSNLHNILHLRQVDVPAMIVPNLNKRNEEEK
jgi:hypothetical protein